MKENLPTSRPGDFFCKMEFFRCDWKGLLLGIAMIIEQ